MGKKSIKKKGIHDTCLESLKEELENAGMHERQDTGIFNELAPTAEAQQQFFRMFAAAQLIEKQRAEGVPVEEAIKQLPGPNLERDVLVPVEKLAKAIFDKHSISAEDLARNEFGCGANPPEELLRLIRSFPDQWLLGSDAPPIAFDAEKALNAVKQVRHAVEEGDLELAACWAAQVGRLDCMIKVRPAEPSAVAGKRLVESRRKGGKATSSLSPTEWELVVNARQRIMQDNPHGGAKNAGKVIYSQLLRGEFEGITRAIDCSRIPKPHTIATKRLKR